MGIRETGWGPHDVDTTTYNEDEVTFAANCHTCDDPLLTAQKVKEIGQGQLGDRVLRAGLLRSTDITACRRIAVQHLGEHLDHEITIHGMQTGKSIGGMYI